MSGMKVPSLICCFPGSVGSSVLSWLSQGLEKVIPQPVPAPGTLQALGKSFETSIDVPDQVGDRSRQQSGILGLLALFTFSSYYFSFPSLSNANLEH